MTMVGGKEVFRDGALIRANESHLQSRLTVVRGKLEEATKQQ